METSEDPNEKLIPFLRNLADSIEHRQLLPRQLQSIGEFFMSYQFQEQAVRDLDDSTPQRNYSHRDLLKFLTLGWFVYCCILENNHIPDQELMTPESTPDLSVD